MRGLRFSHSKIASPSAYDPLAQYTMAREWSVYFGQRAILKVIWYSSR